MKISFNWPQSVPQNQIEESFIAGMMNRMATSYFKYGSARTTKSDGMKNARERMKMYRTTGNTEWLIDAANFLMIEFMNPKHGKAHFRATSSHESPGRILKDGKRSHGK